MKSYRFEELIEAARDAAKAGRVPFSFYVDEANQALFLVKMPKAENDDRFDRELLIEVFCDEDGYRLCEAESKGRCYDKAAFAINAAVRKIAVKEILF